MGGAGVVIDDDALFKMPLGARLPLVKNANSLRSGVGVRLGASATTRAKSKAAP